MSFRSPIPTFIYLLFLSFSTSIHAQPSPTPQPGAFTQSRMFILKDGLISEKIHYPYPLSEPLSPDTADIAAALGLSVSFSSGADIAVANISHVELTGEDTGSGFALIYVNLLFNSLPGKATLVLSVQEPSQTVPQQFLYDLHVIGLALYTGRGSSRRIYSGKSAPLLYLPAPGDDNQILTVNASVYASSGLDGPQQDSMDINSLEFSVQPSSPLTWDRETCRVFNDPEKLDNRCTMAFSPDFRTFSIRVPDDASIDGPVNLIFNWIGLTEFAETAQDSEGGIFGGSAQDPLDGDKITFADIDQLQRSQAEGGTPAWKTAVIAVVVFLLVSAVIILLLCCIRNHRRRKEANKPRPLLKNVEQGMQKLNIRRLQRGIIEKDDNCFVEEVSTQGPSTVLMLEHDHGMIGGVAAGLVPPETSPSKELSAVRLVLPREITRGIDLEPSTDGGSLRFPSSGNDVTSFGRGMTSVPQVMYRNAHSKLDDEEAPSSRRGGGVPAEGDILDNSGEGVGAAGHQEPTGRSSVGAAINRVRQVDLLNGPHSKGLVGRNGEPVEKTEQAEGSAKVLTLSTVS